jgi:hypothetical protein
MDVDINVDLGHAALRRLMRAAFVPTAVADTRVANMRQPQASPLRQFARTVSGELPSEHDLFADLVGAYDVWAQLAAPAFIGADHLLFPEDGVTNEDVGGASLRHGATDCAAGQAGRCGSTTRLNYVQAWSQIYSPASLVPPPLFRLLPVFASTGARNFSV